MPDTTASPMHVVLVTGSRDWSGPEPIREAFRELWAIWCRQGTPVTSPLLISGHCPTGADALAEHVWRDVSLPIATFPADWHAHGKAAGPRRNQQMIDYVAELQRAGAQAACLAFLRPCMNRAAVAAAARPTTHTARRTASSRPRRLAWLCR